MRARVPLSLSSFGERKTLVEWTQDPRCQVSLRELRARIERGWEIEAAIATPSSIRPSRARNLVKAFGEEKSIYDWARDSRAAVSGLTIAARVQRGWDHEEAISTPVHGKARPPRATTAKANPPVRKARAAVAADPVTNFGADEVRNRLRQGAELWFAGSSGNRVTLVERDTTTVIAPSVLSELEVAGYLEVVDKLGTVIQYGLSAAGMARA